MGLQAFGNVIQQWQEIDRLREVDSQIIQLVAEEVTQKMQFEDSGPS
jgi:hypothetical protein